MIMAPMTATIELIVSYLSGFFLSTISPQMIADTMNIPPYAAYTLFQTPLVVMWELFHIERGLWHLTHQVSAMVFFSRSHNHTK